MSETSKFVQAKKIARGRDDEIARNPGVRHAGSSLGLDLNYLADEGGEGLTPEARIAKAGAPADTTMGRGATDLSADVSSTDDVSRARRNAGPERVKTRLPGDISSDPHTDVGADTVPGAQRRAERPNTRW